MTHPVQLEGAAVDARSTRLLLRIGAGAFLAAAVTGLAALVLHPLPDPNEPGSFVRVVDESTNWLHIHVVILLSYLLLPLGFVAAARTLPEAPARAVARLAELFAAAAAGVAAVWMALDGFAIKRIVSALGSIAPDDQPLALFLALGMEDFILALFGVATALQLGVPQFILAAGMLRSRMYPRWLAWAGIVGGGATFVVGIMQMYAHRTSLVTHILIPVVTAYATVWVVVMAVLMWRRSGTVLSTSNEAAGSTA